MTPMTVGSGRLPMVGMEGGGEVKNEVDFTQPI